MMTMSSSESLRDQSVKLKKKGIFLGGPPPKAPLHPIRSSMQLGQSSGLQKYNSEDR